MYTILKKTILNPSVTRMDIEAPRIARKAKAGQFVILRAEADGERIPLTIADYDRENGTVSIIFQIVGATTEKLNHLNEGDCLVDFAGPLGNPTAIAGLKNVCVIGGGVGCAIALPIVRALQAQGTSVTSIIGFRNRDLVILEDEFRAASDNCTLMTDNGSYGLRGNVTVPLKEMLENGTRFDEVIAIGPLVMMKYVSLTTKAYDQKTTVSMNPIMVDGTGMCGGCRLTVGGKMKFACVDGPDFDGHEVDFDEAISRNQSYTAFERRAREVTCNLFRQEVQ